jgi:hypothetical protein
MCRGTRTWFLYRKGQEHCVELPTIEAVDVFNDVEVAYGTDAADLELPQSVGNRRFRLRCKYAGRV